MRLLASRLVEVREDDLMMIIQYAMTGTGRIPPRIWLLLSEDNKARIEGWIYDERS